MVRRASASRERKKERKKERNSNSNDHRFSHPPFLLSPLNQQQNIFNNLGLTQGATIQLDLAPPADGGPRQKVAVRPRSSSSSSGINNSGNVEPELLPLYSNGDPIAGEVRERCRERKSARVCGVERGKKRERRAERGEKQARRSSIAMVFFFFFRSTSTSSKKKKTSSSSSPSSDPGDPSPRQAPRARRDQSPPDRSRGTALRQGREARVRLSREGLEPTGGAGGAGEKGVFVVCSSSSCSSSLAEKREGEDNQSRRERKRKTAPPYLSP